MIEYKNIVVPLPLFYEDFSHQAMKHAITFAKFSNSALPCDKEDFIEEIKKSAWEQAEESLAIFMKSYENVQVEVET